VAEDKPFEMIRAHALAVAQHLSERTLELAVTKGELMGMDEIVSAAYVTGLFWGAKVAVGGDGQRLLDELATLTPEVEADSAAVLALWQEALRG
jgi:hypothetical protein